MKTIKAISLALLGTLIEYYDYALYGFAAPILAQHFFPQNDPTVLLLQAYGIFFAGSCSKPLGSLVFGYIGDRFGRSLALKISILGIAIPTVCIGLLPDYHTLGSTAPCLLLLCRILQGVFVSGESDSARVFIFESLPKKYRCFSNSLAYCLCMLGIYWASFSLTTLFTGEKILLNETFPYEFLPNIALESWRIPFLLAGVFGLFLFVLRQSMKETPAFLNIQKKNPVQNNTWRFNIPNKFGIFITLLMTGAAGGQYHFYFVFLPIYLGKILNLSDPTLATVTSTQQSQLLLIFALCLPLAGLLADKLGQRFTLLNLLKITAILIIFLAITNIIFIQQGSLPFPIMVITAVALSFAQANTFVVIINQFNVRERCRGTSLGHALGSMLLSGSTPFISLWIWKFFQIPALAFCYFLILCILSYIALQLLERQQQTSNIALIKDSSIVTA